jgi:hypothetical protein
MRKGNYYTAKKAIEEIENQSGFYDVVRDIVGFYNGTYWEDWEIKSLQRIADARYIEITKNL